MKKELTSRKDIEKLVDKFYNKVKADTQIGFIFTDIANVNWEKHLPIMYDFFENILFYSGPYKGNIMELHKHVSHLYPLTWDHFNRWLSLFCSTVDELFTGNMAEQIKKRAEGVANIMRINIANEQASSDKIF